MRPDYDWNNRDSGNPAVKYWKNRMAKEVVAIVNRNPVLDVGCGSSFILSTIDLPDKIGLDIDFDKIRFMKDHDRSSSYKQGSVYDIPYRENRFSSVLCIEVLEHLHDPARALEEIARVTQPEGTVILATPNFASPIWLAIEAVYGLIIREGYHQEHTMKFTESSLRVLAGCFGLEHKKTSSIWGADLIMEFTKCAA